MTTWTHKLLLWSPRILGILFGLFLGMFALDSVGEGVGPFLVHCLPAIAVLLIVAASWRWEWVGGAAFIALALIYAVFTGGREHLDWLLVIAVPLLIVGLLFLVSWRHHEALHGSPPPPTPAR